jgi:hypothetical protein
VQGIAILSRVANVIPARCAGVAFTGFFIHDTLGTSRKALKLNGCGCLVSYQSCKETRENKDGYFHIFPHAPSGLYDAEAYSV